MLALTAGGTGNNWGAVVGAFLVVFFMEATRFATGWLPGLFSARARDRWRQNLRVLAWHLRGRPEQDGLRRAVGAGEGAQP